MTLNNLSPMQKGTITHITASGQLGQRLCDLGLCPGTDVLFVRKAPLADPIDICIEGYHVALRCEEAKHVQVTLHD